MIKILIIIFVLLSLVAGGNKTAKAIMTTAINISIFALLIELIYLGFNISISTIIAVLLITAVTIFYQNDRNIKTKSAFMSVILVLSISVILIVFIIKHAHLQGFGTIGDVKIHESNGYSVSSGVYEIARHNPDSRRAVLFGAGMNIGCKILSSNVNTLFFIFAGEFMIMCISFLKFYSWSTLINSKDFTQELIAIMISAIGTVIIIPVSSYISARLMS